MLKKLSYLNSIIILFIISSCDFTSAGEYYNQAQELEKKGNLEAAISKLDKAIKKEPEFRAALLNRGVYKSELAKYDEANKDYQKVLEFDSDNTYALFNIGLNFQKQKLHKLSIPYFSKALKTEGALESIASSNGDAWAINTNIDLKRFDSDADYNMFDSEIYYQRAVGHLEMKDFDKAISDFKTALKSNYSRADCFYLIGEAYLGKKDSTNACQNFIESAKLGDLEAREMLKKHCLNNENK
ncbi:tetratricopeptide repeat protein [Maribacter sp. 2210JD10-5]|uniref:tetratricopeptide repeat protein n=1 Tax=Maribacter sp. 2210JD10-5 TaxID=3386272 RepID=UPI0039BD315F